MQDVDAVVVGAGVVGLAVARALACMGRETLILEARERFGTETSARNSEVIHAGIYYPSGSLKARLCVAGRQLLYAYCAKYGIAHRRCGKLIVAAAQAQLPELERIRALAAANGVELESLTSAAIHALEPELSCSGALWSPSTGILDSHEYMLALLGQAQSRGAVLVTNSRVTSMRLADDWVAIEINDAAAELRAQCVINCAGLHAPQVARSIEGFPHAYIPTARFAKGCYFAFTGQSPFERLIYPVSNSYGLGVHLTLDLAGRARFGPDFQWVDECTYEVEPARAEAFYAAIRQYWPGLPDGTLQPAYAGIRPKISAPGEPEADFRIDGPVLHGVPGVVNLFGIESPGLTASLAIAEYAAAVASSNYDALLD